MSQDVPWAFGLRAAKDEKAFLVEQVSLEAAPFFAVKGHVGNLFQVIGDDLEECLQMCLDKPTLQALPQSDQPQAAYSMIQPPPV